ncbi:hypothetical protein [Desulfopila sp. IMCC35008]|uniref:hypothetical protein n=1 Tax=Desulfopila sp. IMCC35008 TaxID=2653858 RepID=UPI0013D0ED6B|nr:hypothetical protein [Desulfopila sp. IMCC35008]
MNSNQLLKLVRLLAPQIQDFLGGRDVAYFKDRIKDPSDLSIPRNGGVIDKGSDVFLCFKNRGDDFVILQFSRPTLQISPIEIRFLMQLCEGVTVLVRGFDDAKHGIHHRTVIMNSAFDIAVSRFLRGDTKRFDFDNVQHVIEIAKKLTYQRYEGAPCTSAFIYVNKPTDGFLEEIETLGFHFASTPNIQVTSTFYGAPISYRYVDGIQSAFLLQPPATCVGIVQLGSTKHISSYQGTHDQFVPVLEGTSLGSFAVFITPNSEVDVLFAPGCILRWQRGRWTLIELPRIASLIAEHLSSPDSAELLCKIVVGISATRHGGLIILSDHTLKEIGVIRGIDDTDIGKLLRKRLLNLPVADAYRSGVFTAAVTSDGMTVIDSSGVVRDSGALIDLGFATAAGGGGRTAAAQSASLYGLVIKISEDGPIEFWRRGEKLMQVG